MRLKCASGGEMVEEIREEINGQIFTSRRSRFCFVHSAQALLNSTPQLLARDRRTVAQGAQLGSGDLRMDAAI
jgi:hypothetical protein